MQLGAWDIDWHHRCFSNEIALKFKFQTKLIIFLCKIYIAPEQEHHSATDRSSTLPLVTLMIDIIAASTHPCSKRKAAANRAKASLSFVQCRNTFSNA